MVRAEGAPGQRWGLRPPQLCASWALSFHGLPGVFPEPPSAQGVRMTYSPWQPDPKGSESRETKPGLGKRPNSLAPTGDWGQSLSHLATSSITSSSFSACKASTMLTRRRMTHFRSRNTARSGLAGGSQVTGKGYCSAPPWRWKLQGLPPRPPAREHMRKLRPSGRAAAQLCPSPPLPSQGPPSHGNEGPAP